jgi:hypothetical protein
MEQSAVEWFAEKVGHNSLISLVEYNELLEQAKEMDKEKEEQFNTMLSMLQEASRRLENTDIFSLRKEIREVLTLQSQSDEK